MEKQSKILIIDDTHETLDLVTKILTAEGYSTFSADSGELALIALQKISPDLILLDINMPGIDGFEVCKQIKLDTKKKSIPIIFLSATTDVNEKIKAFNSGGVDYITKPLQKEELIARVNTHIELYNTRINLESKNNDFLALNEEYKSNNEQLLKNYASLERVNNRLKIEKKLLNLAGKLTNIGAWEINLQNQVLTWTTEVYKIHEVDDNYIPKLAEALDFYDEASKPIITEAVENAIVCGLPFDVELRIKTHKNNYKNIKTIGTVKFDAFNKPEIVYGVFQDITETKNAMTELIEAKIKAEESTQLKSAFLQNISHEIRTPMNAICGFSKLLLNPQISEGEKIHYVDIINKSSDQLLSIVSNIVTMSTIETKQEKLTIEGICINTILKDLQTIFSKKTKNLVQILLNPNNFTQNYTIHTDKIKFIQIVSNIISNAVKFTSQGTIEIGFSIQNNQIEFYISDTGIGIEPNQIDKIFDRFHQANDEIRLTYGGTGLGLSIVKGYVELLGGKIWVTSELKKGSTFNFTIPCNPNFEIIENIPKEIKTNQLQTILVAEDELFNFMLIKAYLNNLNLNIIHANDGQEAIDICKSNQHIDLILMDIKMPNITGDIAALSIKKLRPDLPIIAQTGYALDSEIQKYNEIFDDYISKPMTQEDLLQLLNKYTLTE